MPNRRDCVASAWPCSTDNAYVELLTGFGLATAAGLNAYIPLLALGLLSRFTDLVTLPHGWAWLENGWVMTIVADKIPALDSVNDVIQTFVRSTAGGIVFGSGTAAQTSAVTDPGAFAQSGQWIPVAIGVVTALVVSLTKSTVRPAANVATAGMASGSMSAQVSQRRPGNSYCVTSQAAPVPTSTAPTVTCRPSSAVVHTDSSSTVRSR